MTEMRWKWEKMVSIGKTKIQHKDDSEVEEIQSGEIEKQKKK